MHTEVEGECGTESKLLLLALESGHIHSFSLNSKNQVRRELRYWLLVQFSQDGNYYFEDGYVVLSEFSRKN